MNHERKWDEKKHLAMFSRCCHPFVLGHIENSCKVHRLRYFKLIQEFSWYQAICLYELKLLVAKPWIYSSSVEFCLDEYNE